jgi:hypothetical protein
MRLIISRCSSLELVHVLERELSLRLLQLLLAIGDASIDLDHGGVAHVHHG